MKGGWNMATKGYKKVSSDKMASLASKVLRDNRYSDTAKKLAGSVLSQSKKGKN
jgi:hypothetical protein